MMHEQIFAIETVDLQNFYTLDVISFSTSSSQVK